LKPRFGLTSALGNIRNLVKLLLAQPWLPAAVESVADELEIRTTLSGSEVEAIVERWRRDSPGFLEQVGLNWWA